MADEVETKEAEAETKDIKATVLELAFDEASTKILDEMVEMSKSPNKEKVIRNAIRVYDWYLRNQQYQLIQKRGPDQYVSVNLKLD